MGRFWDSVIRTQCSCQYDEKLWYFSNEINALLYIDKETMKSTYVTSFSCFQGDSGWLFTKMIPTKDALVMIPYMAKDIVVYYPEKNQYESIVLNKTEHSVYFITDYIDDTTLLLFPALSFEYYYCLDLEKKKVKTNEIDLKNILNEDSNECFMSGIYSNGCFYTNILKDNKIYKFDLKTKKFDSIKSVGTSINSMCRQTNDVFGLLNGEGDNIYIYDINKSIEKQYNLNPNNKQKLYMRNERMGYSDIKQIGNHSWMALPVYGNDIRMCVGDSILGISLNWDKIKTTTENAKVFSEIIVDENYIFIFPYQANTIVRIEKSNFDVRYFEKDYKSPDEIRVLAKYYIDDTREIIYEGKVGLQSFLEYLRDEDEIIDKKMQSLPVIHYA